jgi:fucokinase
MLTSGGGWQDQIGGLIGGFKLGVSKAGRIPVATTVERIDIPLETKDDLNCRLVLVFTGQTRLAKNILQNVLRRWARRTPEIVATVMDLVRDARNVAAAMSQGDLATVADCLNQYWGQKKIMAGDDSGVEPPVVKVVLEEMLERKLIDAGSLCGAGGGGFMVLLLSKDKTMEDVRDIFIREILPLQDDAKSFEWYTCTVSTKGITTLEASGNIDFDFQWHGLNEG